MQVENDKVIAFHYRLTDEDGKLLEHTRDGDPMLYMHGKGNVFRALEEALEGLGVSDTKNVTLQPEQAYGRRVEGAQQRIPIKHLLTKNKKFKVGDVVRVNTEQGAREAVVLKVGKFNLDVDTNHPYAGKTVTFDIEITDIREADAQEIAHGHPHGPGGHQH